MKNGGRVHHGELNKHLVRVNNICPILTRSMSNRLILLYWTSVIYKYDYDLVYNEVNAMNYDHSRHRS